MSQDHYDVVIVGAGISGAILGKELAKRRKRVLILEAGDGTGSTWAGYQTFMETFFTAWAKIPNAPFPQNPNAPQPLVTDVEQIDGTTPSTTGYFVQRGPEPFSSTNTRSEGGTTLHWLGTCLRMLPSDFNLRTLFGQGVDWPITYDELEPYYQRAEHEIGVSADVCEQEYLGITFPKGYEYPMQKIPQSYLDQQLSSGLNGWRVDFAGERREVNVVSTPQGRNSMPNGDYQPVGAVGSETTGQRCEGNSNCTPICPVQAKYSALKTLRSANARYLEVQRKSVASKIEIDPDTGRVTGIVYKRYHRDDVPEYTTETARGTIYVVAAHAIESAKLLLASGVANSSGQVGRNLMDHPVLLTWGLMPQPIGAFRGPGSTSGIPSLRDGRFRADQSAFRVEIGNWGWSWPTGSPFTTLVDMVDHQNLWGRGLRRRIGEVIPRQFRFGFLVEQVPQYTNTVSLDPSYLDPLGNFRPVLSYNVSEYERAGMAAAKQFSDQIFQRMGVEDFTEYNPSDPGYLTYNGVGYTFNGAGHEAGTHRMGAHRHTSVVDRRQRSWDHENLFMVGCGNMPTIGTSNPTLTMAALACWAADNIVEDLK